MATGTAVVSARGTIVPGMFGGPGRLAPWLPMLRRLPAPVARQLLVALAVGDGVARSGRLHRALSWSEDQHAGSKWSLALRLLANHGRFVADEAMIGIPDVDTLQRDVIVHGAEHFEGPTSGGLLLGFHLGPPRTAYVLRALGYPVRLTGRLEGAREDERWDEALKTGEAVRLPTGAPRGRAEGLHRIRTLLRQGGLVYLAGDGPFGREAFRIDLPGGPLVVRLGWLAMRRLARVPTFPVFTYREGGRRVIVIHPSLPQPDADSDRDTAQCQAALTPLVESYVRRYPDQCRYLAFPAWEPDDPSSGAPDV
jgi:lauroyl/myristoyl acyltransferase